MSRLEFMHRDSTNRWRLGAVTGLLLALTACATTDGIAVRGPAAGTATVAISTTGPTSMGPTSMGPTTTGPITTGPTSGTPAGPPSCGGTINHLTTPTGAPILTVTAGANSFIANQQVEPLSLAVYADGTALSSLGVGTASEPLPAMTIGYIPPCTLDWAEQELESLRTADLGRPNVTDQGTTEVSYRPESALPVHLSAYALGIDDKYVLTGRSGRARLTTVLAALRGPLAGASSWTPDRLRVVEVPVPVGSAGTAVKWPGPVRLEQVLTDRRFDQRCGVVGGAQAAAVLRELGNRSVYSGWTDAGATTGLDVGALVPGQSGCGQD